MDRCNKNSKFVQCLLVCGTLCIPASMSYASGFRLPEASIAGLGTANALVANHKDRGAIAYNPAAMSFHTGSNLLAGLLAVDPNISVKTTSGSHDSDGASPVFVPSLHFQRQVDTQLTYGVSLSAPFGLETKWKQGTFPSFSVSPPLTALEPKLSRIKMINLNPNIAYKLQDNASLAFGVDYYYVDETALNTQAVEMGGDGSGWGWNIAALYALDAWSFGLSYRSSVEVDIDGKVATSSSSSSASTALEFPSMLQVGARYQANEKLAVEFDIERTGWSSFDEIIIKHSNPAVSANPIVNDNSWEDVNAYRVGLTYQLSQTTELRFGYTFDENPQPDENFSARVPDADRQLFSIGAKHSLSGLDLEWGLMYAVWDDRTINSSTPFPASQTNLDANGTAAYNGNYESNAILVGIGIQKAF